MYQCAITIGYVITFHMKEKKDVMQAVLILDPNKSDQGRYLEGGDTAASLMKRS